MKPNFALNFTDTGLMLLHRTAKGWSVVGETPLDAPDLTEALDYLRKTALGLEPGGFTTKLVIPNSQILYAEIEAPGPTEEERRAQIAAELEGRTPYKADEIAFDFSGRGKAVKVAAVARETLTEAEAFAAEHRFNPVSFVAIPEGNFSGEPWFGPSSGAAALIGAGEMVDRDRSPIALPVPRASRSEAAAAAEPAAEPEVAAAEPEPEPTPEPQTALAAPEPAELTAAPAAEPEPEILPVAEAPAVAEAEAAPEPAFRPVAKPSLEPAPLGAAAVPPPMAAPLPPPTAAPATPPETETASEGADEAPFTHVTDASPFPETDEDDVPPMPAGIPAGARVATLHPAGGSNGPAAASPLDDDDLPPPPSAAALAAFSSRRAAETLGAPQTRTAPPLPSASRPDAAALVRAARGKPIEDLPPMPRPVQAATRPALPAAAKAAAAKRFGGLVTAPTLPGSRKVAKGKAPAPVPRPVPADGAAPVSVGDAAKSLARSPFAARPAQTGKPRYLFLILVAILFICFAIFALWSSLVSSSDEADQSAFLADGVTAPEGVNTGDVPAIEDEMLADAQDPDTLEIFDEGAVEPDVDLTAIEPETAPLAEEPAVEEPVAAAEPAPDTGAASDSPAAVTLVDPQDEIFLATADTPPPAFDALSLPEPTGAADTLPSPPMPPPAPGTVYRFDDAGRIVPTPEGIPSPEGFMLYAGKPDLVPPPRSAVAEAAALVAAEPAAAAAPAEAGTMVEALPVGEAPAETAAAPAGPEAQPDPDLADRRPRERPAELAPATAEDDAALSDGDDTSFASLRPRERPVTVLAASERAREETAAASLAAPDAVIEPAALSASDASNPSLLAISRRPAAKPEDFSRAVEAAVAAAVRAPEPAAKAPDATPEEQAEEPEVVASAAPKIPTKASVAKTATFKNAINLSKINLIGVYGTQSNRYALIRQANGRYKKVKTGDRFDGGRVEAITQNEVRYQKGGRLVTLSLPKG
jgi:hypothetical protein